MNPEWKEYGCGLGAGRKRDYGSMRGGVYVIGREVVWHLCAKTDGGHGLPVGLLVVRHGSAETIDLAAEACDSAMSAFFTAIEARMPLTVARALRTPEARRGIPIRFRYAEPTETNDGRIIIRYNPRIDEFDHLDKTNWLPYRLTIDDLDRPAELMLDGVDMEG